MQNIFKVGYKIVIINSENYNNDVEVCLMEKSNILDNVEIVKKAYNAIAYLFAPILEVGNSSQAEVDFMDKFMTFLPENGLIADLGCGTGKHGRYCAGKGYIVTGYDISDKMISLAEKFNESYPRISLLKIADIRYFEYKELYDGVVAMYSLIHLTRKQTVEALENVKKHMKPGAYIIISVYLGTRDGYEEEALDPTYLQYICDYSENAIVELLENIGFTIVEVNKWCDEDDITASNPDEEYGVIGVIAHV